MTGLDGGKEEGLELVSSVELSDSLRKWVYLVFGESSIVNLPVSGFFFPFLFSNICIYTGSGNVIKAESSLSQRSKFLSKTGRGHLWVSLRVNPLPSVFFCSLLVVAETKQLQNQL